MKREWIATGVYVAIAWIVYFVGEFSNNSAVSFFLSLGHFIVLLAGAIALIVRLIMNIVNKKSVLAVLVMILAAMPFCFMSEIREIHVRVQDFFLRDERMAVIEGIRAGEITENEYGRILLTEEKRRLSMDGEVRMLENGGETCAALFYNERFMLAGAEVTVYCSDGNPPTEEMLNAWETIFFCKPLGDGWYYVSYE